MSTTTINNQPRRPASAPPPRQPQPPPRQPRASRRVAGGTEDFFAAIVAVVEKSLENPLFMATLVVSAAVIVTYKGVNEPPISDILPETSENAFVKWARANIIKFLGLVVFAPPVLDCPEKYRIGVAVAAASYIYVVPEATPTVYCFQAVMLHLFLHLEQRRFRLYLIFAAFAVYYFGNLSPSPAPVPPVTTTAAPPPKRS